MMPTVSTPIRLGCLLISLRRNPRKWISCPSPGTSSKAEVTKMEKVPSQVLEEMVQLFQKPGTWTQNAYARTAAGDPTYTASPMAKSFCLYGGVMKVVGHH